jgi:predicted CXXCH cytochrome family protein
MNSGTARHVRVRAVVAHPAVTVALVVSVALALTPFGPSKVMALTAPAVPAATAAPTSTPSPTTTPLTTSTTSSTTSATPSPTANPSPSSTVVAVPGATPVDHHVIARIEGPSFQASYLPVDVSVLDAEPFQRFRVRFQLHNAGTAPITVTPRLEYRANAGGSYTVVPEEPVEGVPFHMAREWVPSLGLGGGTMQGPLGEDIAVADLRIAKEAGFAVTGHHSMGANPDQPVTLPSGSYTEEEFTVKLSIDAKFLTGYELRITDAGTPLAGMDPAELRLGAPPAVLLSPDQHQGVAVPDPTPATSTVRGALPDTMSYPLVAGTPTATIDPQDQIHGPYSMTTDKCGICHRTHTAKAPNLLALGSKNNNLGSQSTLCLSCHNGTGAKPDAGAQYGLVRSVNVPGTREYYSHDAVDATPSTAHTDSQSNEFGSVDGLAVPPLNRHSECTDCHNPHKATVSATRDATQNTDGWGVSGRLTGVSGVSVVNSPVAGAAPTSYAFLEGDTNLVTREYQICFKCHSGFTTLTSNADVILKPSKYALDKAVEFNPANPSFHPVEAKGTNQTAKMAAGLAGSSPYKLWNFTTASTIRCVNCHASSATSGPNPPQPVVDPALPLPGGALAPHTSVNRGILLRPYRDRVLKPAQENYAAKDFGLCLTCHAEVPFINPEGAAALTATNFQYHGLHLNYIAGFGAGGTDIDTPGDGKGNAICAECHFRLHSTTNKVPTAGVPQDVDGSRLVNFAPNVLPYGTATPMWKSTGTGYGTCSITCHGYSHTTTYTPIP